MAYSISDRNGEFLSVVRRAFTPEKGVECWETMIEDDIPGMMIVYRTDTPELLKYWMKFNIAHRNEFFLRTYSKGKEEFGHEYVVVEDFECTLEKWKGDLLVPGSGDPLYRQVHPSFLVIMFDILSGLIFVHELRLVHRDIRSRSIFITKDGHARLGCIMRPQEYDAIEAYLDWMDFKDVVVELFQSQGVTMPFELTNFFDCLLEIDEYMADEKYMLMHPVFLSPPERSCFCFCVPIIAWNEKKYHQVLECMNSKVGVNGMKGWKSRIIRLLRDFGNDNSLRTEVSFDQMDLEFTAVSSQHICALFSSTYHAKLVLPPRKHMLLGRQ